MRYSFTFWEDVDYYSGQVKVVSGSGTSSGNQGTGGGKVPVYHQVVKGDTLWGIANRYGLTLSQLIELNPQIKNPNLIHVGEAVRVS